MAVKAHIELAEGANPAEINVSRPEDATARPDIKITVKGGTAQKIKVTAVVKLDIVKDSGSAAPGTAIPVDVTINDTTVTSADKVEVSSAVQVAVTTKSTADVSVALGEGAENSTVKISEAATGSTVSVDNQTANKVTVTKPDSSPQEIASGKKEDIPVAASDKERLNVIVAAVTWDKISKEEKGKVTANLTLPAITDLGLDASVVSGAAINWTVEPASATLTISGKVGTVVQPEGTGAADAAVTLKATITGFDTIADGSNVVSFPITIPAKKTAAEITVESIAYTVTTGTSVAATGSSISITDPTVAGAEFKYGVSETQGTEPGNFVAKDALPLLDSSKTYYLWVQVTVGETTEKFWGQLDVASTGSKNVTMTKFVPSDSK